MTNQYPDFTPIPEGVAYFMVRVLNLEQSTPDLEPPTKFDEKEYPKIIKDDLKYPKIPKTDYVSPHITIGSDEGLIETSINSPMPDYSVRPLNELFPEPNLGLSLENQLDSFSREQRAVLVEQSDGVYVVRRGYIPEDDDPLIPFSRVEGEKEILARRDKPYTLHEIVERAKELGEQTGAPVLIRPPGLLLLIYGDRELTPPQEYESATLIILERDGLKNYIKQNFPKDCYDLVQ